MNNTNNTLVSFQNVQKSYDGKTLVVKDFNLDIQRGEFVTMLGPSGSGKTTVLMMLAGFESITEGDILLHGQPINNVPPHKRGLGMVFQNYALFPHMTIFENLAYPLQVRKMSKPDIKTKVQHALDMVRLPDMAQRRPAQLSGGQQQRIAVARALVFEPELVLMDEPLGALDKNLREEMQYEIKHIHENTGVSIVYVTHDQAEALTMSTRIAVFNDGIVQQLATPAILYEQPKNAFVAGFIGENNRLDGVVTEIDLSTNTCIAKIVGSEQLIHCLPVNVSGVGEKTSLCIRPERVFLLTQEQPIQNKLSATVLEIIYHGDHLRVRLQVCHNDQFIIKIPNASSHSTLSVGKAIDIGWEAQNCRALDSN